MEALIAMDYEYKINLSLWLIKQLPRQTNMYIK
jgi:hypothetical protein